VGKSAFWPVTLREQGPFGLLRLRPLERQDEGAWVRMRNANHDWLKPWEATSPARYPNGQALGGEGSASKSSRDQITYKQFLRTLNAQAKLGALLPWAIELNGQLVGSITVASINYGSLYQASIGYFIAQQAAGRGIMPTAVAMAVDYLLWYRSIHRIEINIRPENHNSLRVVEKLGFRDEGVRKGYLHINGQWADHRAFALTSEEIPEGLLPPLRATWI